MLIGRKSVAQFLDRTGLFDLLLRARSLTHAPVLPVLCYHSVGRPASGYMFDADVIDATPEGFRAQLAFLEQYFTVIGIDDLCELVDGGPVPRNPLLITFDDGYRSCVDVALPILQDFGFQATFFIATDYVTHRRLYWWDAINYMVKSSPDERIHLTYPRQFELDLADVQGAIHRLLRLVKDERGMELEPFLAGLAEAASVEWNRAVESQLADQLIMSWDDVRTLHDAGMDIESHTRCHRVLQTLDLDNLADELAGSRADIEREIGHAARTVAYPVGYPISDEPGIRSAVEDAGYRLGFTNASGVNYLWRPLDRLDIHRIAMERDVSMAMFRGGLAVPPLAYSRSPS